MATRSVLRRALLYVPGSSQRMLDKSRMLSVDCIAYDLEDSVTPSKKAEARRLVRAALDLPSPAGVRERAVRINSVGSGLALADLTEVVSRTPSALVNYTISRYILISDDVQLKSPNLSTLVVPKVDSASDLTFISDVLSHTLSPSSAEQISILALVESAKAITNLSQICTATPLLSGLIFAAEDFALDLSITRTPSLSEFLYARSAIVTAARAHELPSAIDLVCTSYKQDGGGIDGMSVLEEESRSGKRLGFNGKQCIHPTQVERVQAIFGPEEKEVEWAVRVVIADEKAARQGRGAWTLDGKMIDVPVAEKARAIVRKAEACGIDIEGVKGRWKHQEPE
ncbi:Beta subunit of citrate lyase [Trichophyton interdigitale]|uniref:Beta subunit of citrate lyase n=1 Tax=Trichophyton interdigitale TaxID=101480 RepID=A0A9P4YP15_9EURO|nr:Beta subunit of citrate lyase [Trichophyton interdigitale]KAF3900325.1 Beta subunit of citrate lyase [Trichophyton interdigitale]KAG8211277.1 Beta subunit of citrate lyase [Trichophyton interdigitale]